MPQPKKAASARAPRRSTRPVKAAATLKTAVQPVVARKASRPAVQQAPKPAADPTNQAVLLLALGIMLLAVMLYMTMVRTPVRNAAQDTAASGRQHDPALNDVIRKPAFVEWLTAWQRVDPYVSASEFSVAIDSTFTSEDLVSTDDAAVAGRFVWSPSRAWAADFLPTYGTEESRLDVLPEFGGARKVLARCDNLCRFDRVVWIDDNRLAVLGTEAVTRKDGQPQCPPGVDAATAAHRCYRRLTVDIFDLEAGRRQTLYTSRHELPRDPFVADRHDLWVAGLSAEEREALDEAPFGVTVVLEGTIAAIDNASRLLSFLTTDGQPRFVTVAAAVVVHDVGNNAVLFDAVEKGDRVTMTASRTDDGTLTVFSVRVLEKAPVTDADEPTEE